MSADLKTPFSPACCEGSASAANDKSAQPCGCDEGAGWTCSQHTPIKNYLEAKEAMKSYINDGPCMLPNVSKVPFERFPAPAYLGSDPYPNQTAVSSAGGGAYPMPGQAVRITDEKTGGQKDQKLTQMGALDPLALKEVGNVAGFGALKYARYNFAKGYKWSLNYDALQRHLMSFWAGEDFDPESRLHHLAHAAWHCLALLTFALRNKGTDDRFPRN